ncbi:MAG: 5'-3' exonuclease H3TH domain-containing protein, partial [Pseudomonadota bacterium]
MSGKSAARASQKQTKAGKATSAAKAVSLATAAPLGASDAARGGAIFTLPDGEAVPVEKGSHVYLIDGSGYIFRAFHALPPLTRPSDGLPVGAVHGFCQMLWKLLAEAKLSERPTHFAVLFDHSSRTFRNDIYADYKANRPPPPEELVPQFPLIRDAVKAFNLACIEQEGFEADDLIATYGRLVLEAGGDVTVVSSDKDLMQLVQPGLIMFDGMKNKHIGPDEVMAKFGVAPDRVVDVQALAGDSVDNVPGVPGIGVKTAADLITQFGDLDALLERAGDEIKQPKRREKLVEFAEQARISRDLVRLDDQVDVAVEISQLGVQEPAAQTLLGFLREMEFNTLTRRIADGLGEEAPPAPTKSVGSSLKRAGAGGSGAANDGERSGGGLAGEQAQAGGVAAAVAHGAAVARTAPIDRSKYATVTDADELQRWLERACETGVLSFDTETTGLDPMQAELVGVALAIAPGEACYVPIAHRAQADGFDFAEADAGRPKQLGLNDVVDLLRPVLEDPAILKVGQNLKYDIVVMRQHGVSVAAFDDTMLLSYALDAGLGNHGMDDLAERHLGHTCLSFS